jgi:hypothetical protein
MRKPGARIEQNGLTARRDGNAYSWESEMVDERLNLVDAGHFEDISAEIIGRASTVLITDRFPLPDRPRDDGRSRVWLTINEACGLRDWLNKALPASAPETGPERCPDCGEGPHVDGVWHKPGCPQL